MSSKNKRLQKKKQAQAQATKKSESDKDVNGSTASWLNDSERTASGVLVSLEESRDIKIDQVSLSYHGRLLISNAVIELTFGKRYGLIGLNGAGKSTFLKAIAAKQLPIPDRVDIYLLNEEAPPTDQNALDFVIDEAKKEVARLEQQTEDLLATDGGADSPILDDIYERIDELDPNTFEPRAALLLKGLGFGNEQMKKPTKDLSGGWRMRVSLAKALFVKPTILLLDEPTNHLDLEACVWLEEYLKTYNRILIVVSHSQDFLNGVCTNIMNLNHLKKLTYYTGNYDTFVRTKKELETQQNKAYDKQQAEIEHIKKFAASAGTFSNLVKQAKSKLKIVEKMEAAGLVEKVEAPMQFKFSFSEVDKLTPPVLSFSEVSFSYNGKLPYLYENIDIAIDCDSRVALVGPNGAGKSTLLKLMVGEIQPTKGRVTKHTHLKLGRYHQHSGDQLDFDLSPIDYMKKKFREESSETDFWRQKLGKFGISGQHQTSLIRTLSDGLRSRLVFAEMAFTKPNILLLDEPTNHLDIESIDSLADAINNYHGGMVLVSHDFRLISQVAKTIWLCKDGKIKEWSEGGIESYKSSLRKKVKLLK